MSNPLKAVLACATLVWVLSADHALAISSIDPPPQVLGSSDSPFLSGVNYELAFGQWIALNFDLTGQPVAPPFQSLYVDAGMSFSNPTFFMFSELGVSGYMGRGDMLATLNRLASGDARLLDGQFSIVVANFGRSTADFYLDLGGCNGPNPATALCNPVQSGVPFHPSPVPEPASGGLLALGMLAVARVLRARTRH